MQVTVALQAYLQQYSPNGQPVFEYTLPEGDRVTLIPPLAGR